MLMVHTDELCMAYLNGRYEALHKFSHFTGRNIIGRHEKAEIFIPAKVSIFICVQHQETANTLSWPA